MAFTSPKMGLSVWNLLTDPYDHAQLADNFSKIDLHDHTPGRGIQIPTEGLADGAVTAAKLASTLDPSLIYPIYRNIQFASGVFPASGGATTVLLSTSPPQAVQAVAAAAGAKFSAFYLDPADFAVSGKTTVLRLRQTIITNATAPAVTFTAGLYPIATWGGAAGVEPTIATIGAVVSGSTAAIASPAASAAATPVVSTEFTFPAAGWYALGVAQSGSPAGANTLGQIQLQLKHS